MKITSDSNISLGRRDGTETLSVAFANAEKRASWEETFAEAKLKLRGTRSNIPSN